MSSTSSFEIVQDISKIEAKHLYPQRDREAVFLERWIRRNLSYERTNDAGGKNAVVRGSTQDTVKSVLAENGQWRP